MKKQVFSFRLDEATSKRLCNLAHESQRSRGNVIRWLINRAHIQEGLFTLKSGAYSSQFEKVDDLPQNEASVAEVQG